MLPEWAVAVVITVTASVVLRVNAARLEEYLTPWALVRLCTAAVVATALALDSTLAALAVAVAGRDARVARAGRWSVRTLEELIPVPTGVGMFAGLVFLTLTISAALRAARLARDLASAEMVGRQLRPKHGGAIVIDDDVPDAYALAGLRGCVVVTTGMLRSLPSNEQAVLLEHEMSHVRHRHHLYVQVTELAVAANPLLQPIAPAVRHGVERWADEDSAAATGDRRLAARTIARAGLARASLSRVGGVRAPRLAAVGGRVGDRAAALLAEPPRRHRAAPAALVGLIVIVTAVTGFTVATVQDDFRDAQEAASLCEDGC